MPCYNEAHRLDCASFRAYLAEANCVRLIFVDDGSKDGTGALLNNIRAGYESRASVLHLDVNKGKGEAVRLGVLHALREDDPHLVGFWDADLATPLSAIERFIQIFERMPEIEMVFGSRVKLLGRQVKRDPRRHYMGRVFATVVSTMLELPIYDTQCGAKLFRVSSGIEDVLAAPFLSRWVFDVEMIARYRKEYRNDTRRLERAIYEYPLEFWEDKAGSKVRPSDFVRAALDVYRIWSTYLRR